jgi:hypothetical protein
MSANSCRWPLVVFVALLACMIVPPGREGPLMRDMDVARAFALARGYHLALRQLSSVETCAALFMESRLSGSKILRFTLYIGAQDDSPICRAGGIAFTKPGSGIVWLCPAFAGRTDAACAVTLLHEAMHTAGFNHPSGREASIAFSKYIAERCHLTDKEESDDNPAEGCAQPGGHI